MRTLILFILITAPYSYGEGDLREVYLAFEKAYMSNDVSKFKPLLAKEYKVSQTLHIPGGISDTKPVSKKQLLKSMKAMNTPNTMPRSKLEDVNIEVQEDGGFCGESITLNDIVVSGKPHEEKEVRNVCFKKAKQGFWAVSHKIDVYFTEL